MTANVQLTNCLVQIKQRFEDAITTGGRSKVHSLIRSHGIIEILHEYIKNSLVACGVSARKVYPPVGSSSPEVQMIGFLKKKKQDITVLPSHPRRSLVQEGVLVGLEDTVSREIMDRSITINVRSQLSSLGKNFDTLYERTFAEALNLHLRAPNLIMGEVYLVPLVGYDPDAMSRRRVRFHESLPFKYIPAFGILNGRSPNQDAYKYERLALMIVDFRDDPPTIIDTLSPFVQNGSVSRQRALQFSLASMSVTDFAPDILEIYRSRHRNLQPLF